MVIDVRAVAKRVAVEQNLLSKRLRRGLMLQLLAPVLKLVVTQLKQVSCGWEGVSWTYLRSVFLGEG